MRTFLTLALLLILSLQLGGCGGGGGGGGVAGPSISPTENQKFVLSGSVALPTQMSATVTTSIHLQQYPIDFSVVFVASNGARILGEFVSSSAFVIRDVPPCTNSEIQFQSLSGKILLLRFVDLIDSEKTGLNINSRSTAITYFIRNLTSPQSFDSIDGKVTNGSLDIGALETAILDWLSGNAAPAADNVVAAITQSVSPEIIALGILSIQGQNEMRPMVAVTTAKSNPTGASPIPIRITFSKVVTGFQLSDVIVTNGAPSDLQQVTGDPKAWTVNITPTISGPVTISIPENAAQDASANGNLAPTPFSITYDNVKPTVSITTTAPNPTTVSPIPVRIVFSKAITGFQLRDIVVSNGSASDLQQVIGDQKAWTFNVTPTAVGQVSITIPENAVQDSAGNGSQVPLPFSIAYREPNVPPSVTITAPTTNTSFSLGSVAVFSVSASDQGGSISRVEFYQGSTKLGEATTPPYTFSWVARPSGVFSFTAKATDNEAVVTTSLPVSVTVPPTSIGGAINSDQTWFLASSPYEITSQIQIAYGKTVTVEPGVEILGGDKTLQVFGSLIMIGNSTQKIKLSKVNLLHGSSAGQYGNMNIQFCEFSAGALLKPQAINGNGNLLLKDSVLKDLPQFLVESGYPGDCVIERNVFVRCGEITAIANANIFIRYNAFVDPTSPLEVKCSIRSLGGTPIIEYNSFLATDKIAVSLGLDYVAAAQATNNFWNTSDDAIIANMIYDKNDNLRCNMVVPFLPKLTAPHPNTPDPTPYL